VNLANIWLCLNRPLSSLTDWNTHSPVLFKRYNAGSFFKNTENLSISRKTVHAIMFFAKGV